MIKILILDYIEFRRKSFKQHEGYFIGVNHNEDLYTNNLVSTLVKYKFKTFVDMGDNSKANKIGPMNR